jgi:ribosomal protein S15P/S13E
MRSILRDQLPIAIFDFDHHARALVEAEVALRRHIHDAMRDDDILQALERITQRRRELLRARLRTL